MSDKIQMFMLPFAGGSSVSFKKLLPFLDHRIEVITVEYAGRMTRKNEKYIDDYDVFLQDVTEQIKKYRDKRMPYAVFGYSLGSVLAYDLLSKALIEGSPIHAFICAKGSILKKTGYYDYETCPDEDFIEEIMALGGTDKRFLSDCRFLEAYMRPVKADYIIWGKYRYMPGKIPCDATAIYSMMDPAAEGVHDWSLVAEGTVDYYEMGTNHFFINEYWQKVANIVNTHLIGYLE